MTLLIRDLPRFAEDCKYYQEKIAKIENKKDREFAESMYADFLIKVEAVDRSVEDMAGGLVAVGLQHSTFVNDLKEARLRLHKYCEKL